MTRQEELILETRKNATAIQQFKGSEAYKIIMGAVDGEIAKLKNSYDCKTLQEIATLKGEYTGLTFVPNLIDRIEQVGLLASEQAKKIERKKAIEEEEIDSTSL